MSLYAKGVIAALVSCILWGLSSLIYYNLSNVQATEIIAHRSIWSFVFIAVFCVYTHRLSATIEALRSFKNMTLLFVSSVLIAANWLGFIWAVQTGHGIEASLGYYMIPLLNTAFGVALLSEKLGKDKVVALILAAVGVLILAFGLGIPPWFALFLSSVFSLYGLIRKVIDVGPITGTFVESIIMLPIAAVWIFLAHYYDLKDFSTATPGGFGKDFSTSLLLISTGIFTGLPLILFTYASRALGLTTSGLFFYLNPTIQLIVAILAFNESITLWHAIAIPLIWAGLAIVSITSLRNRKKAKKEPSQPYVPSR